MQQLFSEFKPNTAAEWKARIIKDLKGEAFESLVWKNENGIDIQPFYTSEDLKEQYQPAFTHANWEICVHAVQGDQKAMNRQMLKQLNSGATAISVNCEGLDPSVALHEVGLNFIQSTFYAAPSELPLLDNWLSQQFDLNNLSCALFPRRLENESDLEKWTQATEKYRLSPDIKTACFNALPFHNLNCYAYYEVALILSGLNEFLNKFSKKNSMPLAPFVVKTGVNSDYFMQIAKLRAIRRLWNNLNAEYGIKNELYVIVETSLTNKSISDSYNNLLRTTIESMAAVSGGCNELLVTSFDLLFPVNPNLSERMAVNQQLILKEESYLDKMADIACGSYYIESITDAIATKALETLKRFENEGGYFQCLEKKIFSKEITLQAADQAVLVNTRQQVSIGVNKFRNEKETIRIDATLLDELKHMAINNPVLNFELENYFK
jgi:methylmalonyl-CoA mutase